MNRDDANRVATAIRISAPVLPFKGDTIFDAEYLGMVYSKGRPRASKHGHVYTPENTRKFEKAVKEWLSDYGVQPVYCPVAVELTVYDRTPASMPKWKREFIKYGMTYSQRGDLDNKAKAVLDAANGELYMDDSQISYMRVYREYANDDGFHLNVWRSGFSEAELDMIREAMRCLA